MTWTICKPLTYDAMKPCPKCGCKLVATRYERDGHKAGMMKRSCEHCTYSWYERPLDAAEKESDGRT